MDRIAFYVVFVIILIIYIKFYLKKKKLYDLCRNKLLTRLSVMKNKALILSSENASGDEIRNNLILPFFQVLEYDTSNACEFSINESYSDVDVDYKIIKWSSIDYSNKVYIQVKYVNFANEIVDFKRNAFLCDKVLKCQLDNFITFSDSVYTVLTNGFVYLFFKKDAEEFAFGFNLLENKKNDIDILTMVAKEYLFSDFMGNNISLTVNDTLNDHEILNKILDFFIRDFLHPQTVALDERIKEEMPYLSRATVRNLCKYMSFVTRSIYTYVQKNYDEKMKRTLLDKEDIEKWIKDKYPWVSKINIDRAFFNGLYFCWHN